MLVREASAKREGKENSDANRGESLDRRSLLDVTLNHLVGLVRKLGAKVSMVFLIICIPIIQSWSMGNGHNAA